ncbi:hypothetical protein [Actinobacillus succinogenes]|uniref:hypothetical protein n=1 Tax=Actinobacillus succinogenes TaxID=67854 RepID=UPI0012E99DE1|nr:hypothetical protein [Actinobacillus succinogenes]
MAQVIGDISQNQIDIQWTHESEKGENQPSTSRSGAKRPKRHGNGKSRSTAN